MKADFYCIDRIENGYAVCETKNGDFIDIPLSEISYDAAEGDVLVKSGRVYVKDCAETEKRRKQAAELLKSIFNG